MKVPDGWEVRKLEDIAEISSGGTPSKNKNEFWINGSIPWIRTTEVQNCILNKEDIHNFITNLGLQNSSAKILPKGTILLAMIGQGKTRGQIALLNFEASTNQNCASIILNQQNNSCFFFTFLLGQYKNIRSVSNSAGKSNLNTAIIKKIKVPIPPLPEQRKIAKILGCWDKSIATCEQLIAASKKQKQALMQQLLTAKKRFPEFTSDWQEVRLSNKFIRVTEKNQNQSTNVVTISAQQGLICQQEFFNKSVASQTLDNYFILRKGEFAYNKSYSKGYPMGAIKRLNRYEDAVVTSLYICFKIKNELSISSNFIEQYFESGLLNRGLTKIATEGGRAHGLLNVKPADFMNLKVKIPCFKEQQKIAQVLTNADKEIKILQQKLDFLKQEKQALMQQLLTGKRRLHIDITKK